MEELETKYLEKAINLMEEGKYKEMVNTLIKINEIKNKKNQNTSPILCKLKTVQRPISKEMFFDNREMDNIESLAIVDYIYKSLISEFNKDEAIKYVAELKRISEHFKLSMEVIMNYLLGFISFDYLDDDAIRFFVIDNSCRDSWYNNSKDILDRTLYSLCNPQETDFVEVYEDATRVLVRKLSDKYIITKRAKQIITSEFYKIALELDAEKHPITLEMYNDDSALKFNEFNEFIKFLRKNCKDVKKFDEIIRYIKPIEIYSKHRILDKIMYLLDPDKISYYLLEKLFIKDREKIQKLFDEDTVMYKTNYRKYNKMLENKRCQHIFDKVIRKIGLY